jgi:hypothetical protein
MAESPTKESVRKYIIATSDVYGEFHVIGIDRFEEGFLVSIYLHSYGRMTTFDKNGDIYLVKYEEIDENFITNEKWRNIQLQKILGN